MNWRPVLLHVLIMQELTKDAATDIADLLTRFSFDLNGFTVDRLASVWLSQYPPNWVRFSLVEALYQGRYKAVSVEQILLFWQRRGRPIYHFNHEFERIIRGRFSRSLIPPSLKSALPSIAKAKPLNVEPQTTADTAVVMAVDTEDNVEDLVYPSEVETHSDNLTESLPSEGAIRSFSDRLKILSSEESLAFLKLRGFENPLHPPSRDLPIQAFKPLTELESGAFAKSKWVKLAVAHGAVEEIHQFVPSSAIPPEFYGKLKSVAGILTDLPQTDLPQTEAAETDLPQTKATQTDLPKTDLPQTEVAKTDLPQTELLEADLDPS
jgi:hypothetical protein